MLLTSASLYWGKLVREKTQDADCQDCDNMPACILLSHSKDLGQVAQASHLFTI